MRRIFTIGLVLLTVGAFAQYQKQVRHFSMPQGITTNDYKANTVVVKFTESQRQFCTESGFTISGLDVYLNSIGVSKTWKKFRNTQKPATELNKWGMKMADLSLIYEFEYGAGVELEKVINYLYNTGLVEYAQPHYLHFTSYSPNDPDISTQTHLAKINAYNAWDVNTGDTTVVVGIVDSGWDSNHDDLNDQLKHNYDDPINSIDDDNDGYVDNYNGWDGHADDNNPQAAGSQHGVHVAGCASAETDNGIGVAAPGFNTMMLPYKAGDGTTVEYGYEGITYCADQGVDIINCSWGGAFGGPLGQDVIDYATINNDALVVAAAGNDNVSDDHYPSAYDYVLSVAATEISDAKSGYSNYGYTIDVCAPGSIYATYLGNSYGSMSGTSMASPVVAGAASLVKSQNMWMNALQVGEQLKNTADDISSMNPGYIGMLGTGRINLGNAMGAVTGPSIDMYDKYVTDNQDDAFVVGDVLSISGTFINYLAPSGNLTATISTSSPYMNITNDTYVIGSLSMMQTADNGAAPFTAEILTGTPLNTPVLFEIDITDGTTSWTEYLTVTVNVDYINIDINDVATTITSKGMIGYNLDGQAEGLGFTYMGSASILWDAALMIGTSDNKVVDMVRGASGTSDQDFTPFANVYKLSTPIFSEFDVEGEFDDALASAADKLGVHVYHKAHAWTIPGHTKYIIVEYTIENESGGNLSDMYAGIYGDWDVSDATQNACATSAAKFMGYTYDVNTGGVYAGVQVLTDGGFNHHAMYNNSADGGGINPNNSYSSAEKYQTLSTAVSGAGGSGADVSNVVSTGPFNLADGENVTVAFALIAGDDLADLNESADSAYSMYNGEVLTGGGTGIEPVVSKANFTVYPNPSNGLTTVTFNSLSTETVQLNVYDVTGKQVKMLLNTRLEEGRQVYSFDLTDLNSGVYFYELNQGEEKTTQKLTIY